MVLVVRTRDTADNYRIMFYLLYSYPVGCRDMQFEIALGSGYHIYIYLYRYSPSYLVVVESHLVNAKPLHPHMCDAKMQLALVIALSSGIAAAEVRSR